MRFFLFLLTLLPAPLFAQDDLRSDWREECRSAIGGTLMGLASEVELARRTVEALELKQKDIEKAKKHTEKVAKAFHDDWKHHEYDPSYNEKNTELSYKLNLLKEQWEENQKFMKDSQDKLAKVEKQHRELRQRAEKLFVIRPGKGEDSVRLEFKKSCPPYQHVCSLTRKEADLLLEVIPPPNTPESCRKYAQIH